MTASQSHIKNSTSGLNARIRPLFATKAKPLLSIVEPEGQIQVHTTSHTGSFPVVLSEALRAAGLGSRVLIAQFLKGGVDQGPTKGINLCGRLQWLRPDLPCYLAQDQLVSNHLADDFLNAKQAVEEIWEVCKESLVKETFQKLVLDEIGIAIKLGFLKEKDLLATLKHRHRSIDVILTGPFIPSKIIAMADQVTELRCCK